MSETPHDFPLPEEGSIEPAAAHEIVEPMFPDLTPVEPAAEPLPETTLAETAQPAASEGEIQPLPPAAPEQPAPKQKYTPAVLAMIAIGLLLALCCLMAIVVTALVLPVARSAG